MALAIKHFSALPHDIVTVTRFDLESRLYLAFILVLFFNVVVW